MQPKNRIKEARKILDSIVNRLRQDYDPEQIILFGSYAYGIPTEESDLDLLIVKDTQESVLERWVRVRKIVSNLRKGFAFSPIIVTPSELENGGKGSVAAFLIQQMLEKYMKGFLLSRGWKLKRTHDLEELLDEMVGSDPFFGGEFSREEVENAYFESLKLIDKIKESYHPLH